VDHNEQPIVTNIEAPKDEFSSKHAHNSHYIKLQSLSFSLSLLNKDL